MIYFNNGELTDQAKQKILRSARLRFCFNHKDRKVRLVCNSQRQSKEHIDEWTADGSPRELLLDKEYITFSPAKDLIAFFEVGYGNDCLYNMKDDTFWYAKCGIFLEEVVVLGSYYGHDIKPAIYLRDTSTL